MVRFQSPWFGHRFHVGTGPAEYGTSSQGSSPSRLFLAVSQWPPAYAAKYTLAVSHLAICRPPALDLPLHDNKVSVPLGT
jgi:hypothetical protein